MQLADSLMENGHPHAMAIKSWVSAVETRQRDFMTKMENYQTQLEQKLGVGPYGHDSHSDRNSDASLESKLQEITAKENSSEFRRTLRERE